MHEEGSHDGSLRLRKKRELPAPRLVIEGELNTAETVTSASSLSGIAGVHDARVDGDRVTFDVESSHLDGAIAALSALGLRSLTAHPPTLEELFLRHYGQDITDEDREVRAS